MPAHMVWISRFKKFNSQPPGSLVAALWAFSGFEVCERVKVCKQQTYGKRES